MIESIVALLKIVDGSYKRFAFRLFANQYGGMPIEGQKSR